MMSLLLVQEQEVPIGRFTSVLSLYTLKSAVSPSSFVPVTLNAAEGVWSGFWFHVVNLDQLQHSAFINPQ